MLEMYQLNFWFKSFCAPSRQIILAADGSFTDAPGSYATANATASARIQISE